MIGSLFFIMISPEILDCYKTLHPRSKTAAFRACLFMLIGITIVYTFTNRLRAEKTKLPITEPLICREALNKSVEENMKIVKNYAIGDSSPYLADLRLVNFDLEPQTSLDNPVIVTAASSNHFTQSKALLLHLQKVVIPRIGHTKIIYYDIGLNGSQHEEIKNVCDCEMRNFPFKKYPAHVTWLWGFAWKPLIIQMVLSEYGFVLWADSAVRITHSSGLSDAFEKAKTHGIAVSWSGSGNPMSLASGTEMQTFHMLGEEPCAFRDYKEFYATFILVYKTKFVLENIMRPWVSCSLTNGCMVLDIQHYTECKYNKVYGECHRFDQSVLSIILNRLYPDANNREKIQLGDLWIK